MTDPATVAYLVGARPNYIKVAPLVARMRAEAPEFRHVVINTGQHYDANMSSVFVDELDLGPPDYELGVGSGTHGAQTGRALERIEEVLLDARPRLFVVPGDVNSTLAGALAAAKLDIPIAHLEAGLRSFDRTMPEELNRILTDQLSTWCFTHSPEALDNLVNEGVVPDRVFPVGNTMIDTLVRMRPVFERSTILDELELEPRSYVLVTLHRPALVDGPDFADVVARLDELAEYAPVVFPVHPRTRAAFGADTDHPRLLLTAPLGYVDFLALESRARCVLTDSGGVQEETTFLGVPCFTMRANTERPVTIASGTNRLIGTEAASIGQIPQLLDAFTGPAEGIEGWDGHASDRAAAVLLGALRAGDGSVLPSARGATD